MIRLRNSASGVVVRVSDDTAASLGGAWKPVEDKTEKPVKRQPKRS